MTATQSLSQNRQLWLAAIKPPMYSVAIIPVIVGTALAFKQTNQINWVNFLAFLGSAILIIAWLNLSNDVFDADTGIDQNKAHSLVNLTANKNFVFWLSNLCLGLGILGIVFIAWQQQDWTVLGLVLLSCALGYTYQGPPFRLGYQGLGEIICFISFGPIAIAATYYAQTQNFSLTTLAPSIVIGLSTSLILFCSHFHQIEDDRAAGKKSPIVRLGTAKSARILAWSTATLFAIVPLFVTLGYFPLWTFLIFASLPFAYELVNLVQRYHNQPTRVSHSKFIAVKIHFWSGILLACGLILPQFL